MRVDELASAINLPVEDMVKIGERQALDPTSQIYKSIKQEVAKKLAAVKAVSDVDKKKRSKNRVYIHHVVSPTDRYVMTAAFPHWEVKFAGASLSSASSARAVYALITEYLFEKVKTSKGKVNAWGVDMRSVVMRSRDWVHVCVPGHEMTAQDDFLRADRAIVAMVNAAASRGRDPGLARKYAQGKISVHCSTPVTCTQHAIAAIALFHKTDTNFRQVAQYMHQHNTSLMYYAIPGGKHLEMCTQGPLPQLKAYIQPSVDASRVDIVYERDMSLGHSYTHSNYLELVARTEVRHGGYIYRKEYDNNLLGVLVYKVTRFQATPGLEPASTIYRSWLEPNHEKQYMVYAPVLSPGGMVSKPSDWSMISFAVDIDVVDEVHDYAMRAQGEKDLQGFIARRLNSKTSTVAALHQVVQRNKLLVVTKFELLVLVIFCSVFMRKYKDGQAIATLAPHARQTADLSKHGMLSMFSVYARSLLHKSTTDVAAFMASIRKFYYSSDERTDLPIPAFLLEPGFVKYSDGPQSNPRFRNWNTPDGNPSYGFYHGLPGAEFVDVQPFEDVFNQECQEVLSDACSTVDPLMLITGNAIVASQAAISFDLKKRLTSRDIELYEDTKEVQGWMATATAFVSKVLEQYPDTEEVVDPQSTGSVRVAPNDGFYQPESRFGLEREFDKNLVARPKTYTESVNAIVNKVINDNGRLVNYLPRLTTTQGFSAGEIPSIIKGFYSDRPDLDVADGLTRIFPGSTLMNTQFFESDKQYGDFDIALAGNKIKIDLSKTAPLKPEAFYLPLVRGHVQPDVKNTTGNVLHAFKKRTHNTPDATVPMDENRLFSSAWNAYLDVFCKPGTEAVLEAMDYVGPDEDAVREWVTRLPEAKRAKLKGQEGFSETEIDLSRNTLMLKQKLKPNLGGSYMTSIKASQIIQYDASGKSTATLSPVIGRKVEREQSVLRSNILVLQRKSIDDINKFLNQFDWRPNAAGERYYIEADFETFDKSQGIQAAKLHWRKCEKYGVLPKLVKFLEEHNKTRSVSALEAGVKAFLDVQRGSGHPDTLDGNNDVNQLVMAECLVTVIKQIEFIIMQGDDIIIAMRGPIVDVTVWESEIARRYNLAIKLSIQTHGYICSLDICHLPDGHSVVTPDLPKKMLSFLSLNKKHEEFFSEQYISYVDSMRFIEDLRVQRYLAEVVPLRMRKVLPNTDSEAIMLLCKAAAALKVDYRKFRNMFALEKTMRYY